MQDIGFSASAWFSTLPHRVMPLVDEWLPGLLLRCDELNHWSCGTTFRYLLANTSHARFGPAPRLMVVPEAILELIASMLMIQEEQVRACTYSAELQRLYGTERPYDRQVQTTFVVRVCPICIDTSRKLSRAHTLLHVNVCQEHQMVLQEACRCGTRLALFSRGLPPFACTRCGRDWADLPQMSLLSGNAAEEQQVWELYEVFLGQGTPQLLRQATRMIRAVEQRQRMNNPVAFRRTSRYLVHTHRVSVSHVVGRLMRAGFSAVDLIATLDEGAI